MAILQIHEVTKVYEGKVTKRALNQLSFEVEEGEFVLLPEFERHVEFLVL